MPVIIAAGFAGTNEPLDKPRVGWRRFAGRSYATTSEDGFPAENASSERTDSWWQPEATPAYWTLDPRFMGPDLQPAMTGAAVGTLDAAGALPAGWGVLGIASSAVEVLSVAPENGRPTIRLRINGTPTGTVFLNFAGAGVIPASAGQTWEGTVWGQVVGGGLTNVTSLNSRIVAFDAGLASTGNQTTEWHGSTSQLLLREDAWQLPANSESVRHALSIVNTGAIDVTLKLQAPEMRRIIFATQRLTSYCGIAAHTLGSGVASVAVEGMVSGAWTVLANASPTDDSPLFFLFPPVNCTRFRLYVTGMGSAPRIGVVSFGLVSEWPQRAVYSPSVSFQRAKETTTRTTLSEGGQIIGRSVVRRELRPTMEVQLLPETWMDNEFDSFAKHCETSPFFIADRPSVYPQSVAYAMCDNDPTPERAYPMDTIANTVKLEMRALRG